ncbi:PHP domain-containing protein [Bacteroides ovatus]|nr:PHP domain-containing protein [Bacteroides ovatus]
MNLGIHTSYELLNACCSPEDLCRKAKWLGHTAVGICDRNTMKRHAEPSEGVRQYRAETYIRLLADNDARRRTCRAEDLCLG